jgi:hypothetical protein
MVQTSVKMTKGSGMYHNSTTYTIQSTGFYTSIVFVSVSSSNIFQLPVKEKCFYDYMSLFHFTTSHLSPTVADTTANLSCWFTAAG